MTLILTKGTYQARFAATEGDLVAAQRLRHLCFIERTGIAARWGGLDQDGFDDLCRHVMVEEAGTGRLVCCFRMLVLPDGSHIGQSYCAQFYDLVGLHDFVGPMTEVGRFCVHPDVMDADVLRVAWGALTRFVDETGVKMLFGCSSFAGTKADRYADAFALLTDGHLAPVRWLPRVKAPEVVRFAQRRRACVFDHGRAMQGLPPLLRTYLAMGGWVSDHAVVDTDLNTMHVFTGLEIGAIPPARVRALRAVAG